MKVYGEPTKRGEFENLLREHADRKSHLRIEFTDGTFIDAIAHKAHGYSIILLVDEASQHLTSDLEVIDEDYDGIASFEVLE